MQLCSIMGDQHLHNLYPSYSLKTNQLLFFSMKVTWIIYIGKIYLFCESQWSQRLFASSVIYHLWWRELGRLPDWTNECKCTASLAWVTSRTPFSSYLFSINSLEAHKQIWHVIYCGCETINFHKEGKKWPSLRYLGHLIVFWQWWWAYMAAQLRSQHWFSVLFRWWGSSLWGTLVVKYMESCIYGSTCAIALLIWHPRVSHDTAVRIKDIYNKWRMLGHTPLQDTSCVYAVVCLFIVDMHGS